MRQAIVTKYIGPTNHRPARVVATCQAGSLTVSWDYTCSAGAVHTMAAKELAAYLGWTGAWSGGGMPDGSGNCYVNGPVMTIGDADPCEFFIAHTVNPSPIESGKRIKGWRAAK